MKRSLIAFAFTALCLIACFCGGTAQPTKKTGEIAPGNPAKPGPSKPAEFVLDPETEAKLPKFCPKPEPVFVLKKTNLSPRVIKQILTSTGDSGVLEKIKIDLTAAEIAAGRLTVTITIHNQGLGDTDFKPWPSIPDATDEFNRLFKPTSIPQAAKKIKASESITETITFAAPSPRSQEIHFTLPGKSLYLFNHTFAFKMGRDFFAKKEDARLATIEENRQRADFAKLLATFRAAEQDEEFIVAKQRQEIIDDAKAKFETARNKQNNQDAERLAEEAGIAEWDEIVDIRNKAERDARLRDWANRHPALAQRLSDRFLEMVKRSR